MGHRRLIAIIGLTSALVVSVCFGHHSFPAVYDRDVVINLEGVVTEVWYENPHARVYVSVTNSDGAETLWELEAAGATQLRRQGWLYTSIAVGDRIIVEGSPAREHPSRAYIRVLKLDDGSVFWAADPAALREVVEE